MGLFILAQPRQPRSGELQPVEADSHDALVHVRLERAGVALDRAVRFPVGPLVVPGVAVAPHGVWVQRVLCPQTKPR